MKDFIFISDFDGTISQKDFYWILIDDYIGSKGVEFYHEWKKDKKIGIEFLNTIFSWHKFSEAQRLQALEKVDMDQSLEKVIKYVQEAGGEFMILSAGFRYYIEDALERRNIKGIKVLTNEGGFKNRTFVMEANKKSDFYSEIYGIDKEKVAKYYKRKCKKLYFAGDSEPDYLAAINADVVFAKGELAGLLDKNGRCYIPYTSFVDILSYLNNEG